MSASRLPPLLVVAALLACVAAPAAAHDWHRPQRDNATVYDPAHPGPVSLLVRVKARGEARASLRIDVHRWSHGAEAGDVAARAARHLEEVVSLSDGISRLPVTARLTGLAAHGRFDPVGHEHAELSVSWAPSRPLVLAVPKGWSPLHLALIRDGQTTLHELDPGSRFTLAPATSADQGAAGGRASDTGQEPGPSARGPHGGRTGTWFWLGLAFAVVALGCLLLPARRRLDEPAVE